MVKKLLHCMKNDRLFADSAVNVFVSKMDDLRYCDVSSRRFDSGSGQLA